MPPNVAFATPSPFCPTISERSSSCISGATSPLLRSPISWKSVQTPPPPATAMPSPSCARPCFQPRMTRRIPVPIPEDERMNDERLNGERSDHEGIEQVRIGGQPVNDPPVAKKFEAH